GGHTRLRMSVWGNARRWALLLLCYTARFSHAGFRFARTILLAYFANENAMVELDVPADIAAMSFEEALAELEQIVRRLEGGQVKLDEAILSYERGALLKRHCEKKLNEAQQRVDRIVIGADGAVTAE